MRHCLFSFLFLFQTYFTLAQTEQWESFIPNRFDNDCLVEAEFLYALTFNGMIKYNLKTDTYEFYNKSNTQILFNAYSNLTKDKFGNIYFMTYNSVVKFDGSSFYEFPFTEKPYLYGHALTADSSGNIWIASAWGLIKFDGSNYTILLPDSANYYGKDFNSVAVSANGDIWVSSGYYLAKFDGLSWIMYKLGELFSSSIYSLCLYFDSNNLLWVGGLGGYCTFDGLKWSLYNKTNTEIIQEDVEEINSDVNGNMWFGTRQGISIFDGTNWTSFGYNSPLPNLWINSIYPIQDGSVFIATQNGLVKYKNGIWQQLFFSNKNFPYEQIHELAVEENGKLWLASGLNDGQEVGFKVYPDSLIFMDDDNFKTKDIGSFYWWITDIFIDRNNTKWIGTSGGLFKVTDDTVQSYYSWNSGIPSYYILSISEDAFGNLWNGTIDGLAKLKNDVWTVYDTLNSGLPNNVVYEVFVDRYQNVWCGTEQGLAKFNGLTWTVYSLSNSQIGENYIHHFAIDKVNHIWLCNSKGLHHFNGTKWETFDELNSKLPTNFINDIKVDSRNNKWLGLFYGGLVLIDSTGKWSLFNEENSPLLKNNVTSLFIDNNDNKWIGTFAGLNVYNENGINTNYVKKPKDEPYYYNLSQNYPNPFNNSSTINYTVESESRVSIKVYDVLGREVSTLVDEVKSYGKYSVQFNASDLPSGVYIYQLQVGNYFITKKAILLK